MAMKIGGEYASDDVRPRHFEQLAEEAGLGKPMVKRRVRELADTMLAKTSDVTTGHATAFAVAALVQNRCQRVLEKFTA